MRSTHCVLLMGAAAQTLAVPLTSHRRQESSDIFKWPNYCEGSAKRNGDLISGKGNILPGGLPDNIANYFMVLAQANYAKDTELAKDLSVPRWAAQYSTTPNQDPLLAWECSAAECKLDNLNITCAESQFKGRIGVVLESAVNLYNYLKSLSDSIEYNRNILDGRLPSMPKDFAELEQGGVPWDKIIGTVTAGIGVFAATASGPAGALIGSAAGLAGAISGFLLPEEEKEVKFDTFAQDSNALTDNTKILIETIDNYIAKQYLNPVDDIQAFLDDKTNFVSMVSEGRFAGDAPPAIQKTDINVQSGLSAPFVNALWRSAKVVVVKFDGPTWAKEYDGKTLCQLYDESKFYEDLQPDGKRCDEEGSLYMIMGWGKRGDQGNSFKDYARMVSGIEKLQDYGIDRQQVIDGSIANHDAGGYEYVATAEDLLHRLQGVNGPDELAVGTLNVWNLAFCAIGPNTEDQTQKKDDIEEMMAVAILDCVNQKDKNGKGFPYGDDWAIE